MQVASAGVISDGKEVMFVEQTDIITFVSEQHLWLQKIEHAN